MKTLGPGFLAEFKKHKNLQESLGKAKSAGIAPKKSGKNSQRIPKKETPEPEGSGAKNHEEEPAGKNQPGAYNRLLREDLLSCGTVLQLSDLPDDGFTDHDIKKLVQPFGKVSDIIVLRSRNEAYLEMNYKEAVMAAVKFGETEPVVLNGKRIRISVAETGQAKKTVKKRVLNPKKTPSSSTKKIPSANSKSPKALPGKKEKLKKIPGEKKAKKNPSEEAGKASAEDSQNPSEAATENPESEPKNSQNPEYSQNSEPKIAPEGEGTGEARPQGGEEAPQSRERAQSHGKDPEDSCVLVLSELPAGGCSVQELTALTKPCGAPRDLLIVSSHRKAFVELPRGAAEALLSSHGRCPLSLAGTRLQLQRETRHGHLGDEEAIFLSLIKDADPKADVSSLRSHLVHLGNLPAEGFRELEVVCAGLRFGKVQHYAVLTNRNTAILQLDSPKSARSMYSFLQQYPYSMGEHTLTCSLSTHGDLPEAETGKREAKREDGSRASSGSKKTPEGSGTAQKPPGNPPGEPRRGQIPTPNVPEEIAAGQLEIPDPQPSGMDAEGSEPGTGIPVDPAGSKPPAAGKGEAGDEAGLEMQKEDEERSASSLEPPESSSKAAPAAGGTPGAVPGTSPSSGEAPAVSPGVTQPSTEQEKTPLGEAGKNSPERKTLPKTPDAPGKKLDVAGAEREGTAEESGLKAGDNPGKSLGKAATELEKTPGKTSSKGGENSGNAAGEIHVGSSVKIPQNKGMGAVKSDESRAVNPAASLKESCLGKTFLKAVVSVPDILKQRIPIRIAEPSLGKAGEQKIPPKAGPERKIPAKGTAQPGAGSSQWKGNGNSGVDAQQGDNGKSSSQQDKDSQLESKQGQQGESGTPGTREDPGGNQAPGGGGAAAWKSGAGSAGKQKEEEELFPFNLDEFVTVDEVLEDAESPAAPRRNPPRAKRKEPPKANPAETTAPKRRRGNGAEGELSFVTLDEIGEEEDAAPGPLPGVDPQGLVVVDEVAEEEELSEAVKDPQALLTLDELSEQEEPGGSRGPRAEFEERHLKAEPLVTVDEIGEVEELPLNEPAELSAAEEGKAHPADCAASQVPDDPNALVTVDELQEDNEDNPLVTLDEVNEDEDDFLADFNHLKEELNFVTVDEVGDEEEESAFPGKNPPRDEDDEDIVAVAGPEEMGILGDTNQEEEVVEISKPKAAQLGTEDAEPKSQQKKTTLPGIPKPQSAPKALDILVPKAGFFCQICSLFYADEASMINHCRTPLHRQNMEKFMAKQQDNGGEEPSSR